MMYFGIFFILFFSVQNFQIGTVYYKDGSFQYTEGVLDKDNGVAWGQFTDTMLSLGWDQLIVTTSNSTEISDLIKAEAAGFFEGQITAEKIYNNYVNLKQLTWDEKTNFTMPEYLQTYFSQQRDFTESLFKEKLLKDPSDPYFTQVGTIFLQLKGIIDGYNEKAKVDEKLETIDYIEWQVMTSAGDIFDLEMLKHENRPNFDKMKKEEIDRYIMQHSHCSALFKLTPDISDIFFGHNSWAEYGRALRIMKQYNFYFESAKAKTIMMSSYPGFVSSFDDFYVTTQNLAVIETTNDVFNMKLYDLLTPKSLLYWERVMIANRMASGGVEWAETFEKYNGGTYNNMWMVLDMKLFKPGISLDEWTFTVLEQIPGKCVYSDQTDTLEKGYFPSYNIPLDHYIYNISGWAEQLEKHPDLIYFYSYQRCPRANIFRRDQANVKDIETMKAMMRYNDYLNDPFTLFQNPSYTVSSRYDLRKENAACDGAYDAKLSSVVTWMKERKLYTIAGPTHGYESYIKPFVFSKAPDVCPEDKFLHKGIPDTMDFPWFEFVENDDI